jgi:ParB family chromosome partitioning protein
VSAKGRKALGRGLSALLKPIEEELILSEEGSQNVISECSIHKITVNPKQPRTEFDTEKLQELAQSIKIRGVIQPLVVRKSPTKKKEYELVAGERRLRACKLAGLEKVPIICKDFEDKDLLEIALIENIQREDLNPLEEAKAYRDLLKEHDYTQEKLAQRVGKSRSTITNLIRLLQLPEQLQVDLNDGILSVGHARALLSLEQEELQNEAREQILQKELSVRETEKLVKQLQDAKPKEKKEIVVSPQTQLNQNRLTELFQTKVEIKEKGKKGKIELEYYNQEDFNRIFTILLKK